MANIVFSEKVKGLLRKNVPDPVHSYKGNDFVNLVQQLVDAVNALQPTTTAAPTTTTTTTTTAH